MNRKNMLNILCLISALIPCVTAAMDPSSSTSSSSSDQLLANAKGLNDAVGARYILSQAAIKAAGSKDLDTLKKHIAEELASFEQPICDQPAEKNNFYWGMILIAGIDQAVVVEYLKKHPRFPEALMAAKQSVFNPEHLESNHETETLKQKIGSLVIAQTQAGHGFNAQK